MIFTVILLTSTYLLAQTITGTVSSDKGDKLPGVSVVIKGTTKGTTTDKDGNYAIDVRKGQTLIFLFVGYELQEVAITDQKSINASLREATETLEEVVVTAENRSVSAQRVPITMDLVNGKTIQKQGVSDLLQLETIAPSLNIVMDFTKSISEVSYELGFRYPQHFTRLFKQKTGMSPIDYHNVN